MRSIISNYVCIENNLYIATSCFWKQTEKMLKIIDHNILTMWNLKPAFFKSREGIECIKYSIALGYLCSASISKSRIDWILSHFYHEIPYERVE